MDGKHVLMKCPGGTGSEFFNYKNSFSIVLLAVVDYNYCFTYIDVGAKGRNSDGGIFNDYSLKRDKIIEFARELCVRWRRSFSLKNLSS